MLMAILAADFAVSGWLANVTCAPALAESKSIPVVRVAVLRMLKVVFVIVEVPAHRFWLLMHMDGTCSRIANNYFAISPKLPSYSSMTPKPEPAGNSFARLAYEGYSRILRNYLMNRVRNNEDARELAQEVWTRLLRVTDPDKIREPRRYIYRVAAHVVAEYQDCRRRNPVQFDSEVFDQTAMGVAEKVDGIEQLKAQADVMQALQPVPPMLREVVLLRLRDGLAYEEIGARLGLTAGTAKRYFFSAMTLARKAWTRNGQ